MFFNIKQFNRIAILGAIILLTVVFGTADVSAQTLDCCLQEIIKGTSAPEITGCRLRPRNNTSCSAPKIEKNCIKSSTKKLGGDYQRICTEYDQTEIRERAVSCSTQKLCTEELKKTANCTNLNSNACKIANACFWDGVKCQNKYDNSICSRLKTVTLCSSANGSQVCTWNSAINACITKTEGALTANRQNTGDILPDCAVAGTCRNLNDLVETAIKVARKLFGLFGSLAFLMFIYGGVRMIASFGSPEQFQKGKSVLSAAVVGIIIAFGAFMLIGYVLSALGVDQDLRAGVTVIEPKAEKEGESNEQN